MIRFLTSRSTVIVVVALFALAFGWNTLQGTGATAAGHSRIGPEPAAGASGPSLPADARKYPVVGQGTGFPPPPWCTGGPDDPPSCDPQQHGLVAQGTGFPPPPWCTGGPDDPPSCDPQQHGLVAQGTGFPPPPWCTGGPDDPPSCDPQQHGLVAQGTGFPPPPWCTGGPDDPPSCDPQQVHLAPEMGLPQDRWARFRTT